MPVNLPHTQSDILILLHWCCRNILSSCPALEVEARASVVQGQPWLQRAYLKQQQICNIFLLLFFDFFFFSFSSEYALV